MDGEVQKVVVLVDSASVGCWMTGLPVPDMILEFTFCKCRHVCQLPSCECMASRLKCTGECSLRECSSMKEDDPLVELEEQDESDEDDSDENDDE